MRIEFTVGRNCLFSKNPLSKIPFLKIQFIVLLDRFAIIHFVFKQIVWTSLQIVRCICIQIKCIYSKNTA